MKHLFVLLSICVVLASCSKKEEQPALSEDRRVQLLADLHMAEAAVQHLPPAVKDSMIRVYYDQVFAQYDINQADYDRLMKLLRDDVGSLQPLYEKVLEELSRREAVSEK
jgi:glycerol-3-phosphate cytidylyltransferase-like family protein